MTEPTPPTEPVTPNVQPTVVPERSSSLDPVLDQAWIVVTQSYRLVVLLLSYLSRSRLGTPFCRLLAPALRNLWQYLVRLCHRFLPVLLRAASEYSQRHVRFAVAAPVLVAVAALVYTRSLYTNYIFDEQEALLANPYVNGQNLAYWDVFTRDFWGLPSTGSIGSYRPLPNMIWRPLWALHDHPWPAHFFNVLLHGVNGALVAVVSMRWLRSRRAAWFAGLAFVLSAVITEAVCGVVGIADVLSGFFILLVLLGFRAAWYWQLPLAAAALFLGLLSKESVITATPIVAWAALVMAPVDHPNNPQRWRRGLMTGLGALTAVVVYTYFRRAFFEVQMPPEFQKPLGPEQPFLRQAMHEFLRWFRQPRLPIDPINNPLVHAHGLDRIAGALRVYFRGLVQVVFPWQLSGDYSFPQEPVPRRLLTLHSVLGGLLLIGPALAAVVLWLRCLWAEYQERYVRTFSSSAVPASLEQRSRLTYRIRALFAVGLLWVPLTYFPHSNIPLLLPTVRAERFWYIPVVATAFMLGAVGLLMWRSALGEDAVPRYQAKSESSAFSLSRLRVFWFRGQVKWALMLSVLFFGFQAVRARTHASHYTNDLTFWQATVDAVPNSAKAHLNYGVMLGARSRLEERLVENKRAMDLAPEWPMGAVYYADTLCRLNRAEEAWPFYVRGFTLGPNQQSLISLGLQCLWDQKAIASHKSELEGFVRDHMGSWLAHLASDIVQHGEKNNGVDPKYRPRVYNGGPRDE